MQYTAHVFRDNVVFAGGIKNVICQVLSGKYIFFIIFYNKENILPISILMIFVWKGWWKSDYSISIAFSKSFKLKRTPS